MKIKLYVVDFEIPRRTKRMAMLVGIPIVLLLGGSAMLYAKPLDFVKDEPLSATKMNNNFKDLDQRVSTLEAEQPVPGPQGDPGPVGPMGDPGQDGAFPGTIFEPPGNNGGSSCDTFCANLTNMWGLYTGTCLAARLDVSSAPIATLNGKYVGCGFKPNTDQPGWTIGMDGLQCGCIKFP